MCPQLPVAVGFEPEVENSAFIITELRVMPNAQDSHTKYVWGSYGGARGKEGDRISLFNSRPLEGFYYWEGGDTLNLDPGNYKNDLIKISYYSYKASAATTISTKWTAFPMCIF